MLTFFQRLARFQDSRNNEFLMILTFHTDPTGFRSVFLLLTLNSYIFYIQVLMIIGNERSKLRLDMAVKRQCVLRNDMPSFTKPFNFTSNFFATFLDGSFCQMGLPMAETKIFVDWP